VTRARGHHNVLGDLGRVIKYRALMAAQQGWLSAWIQNHGSRLS